jgi:hypothetical protein
LFMKVVLEDEEPGLRRAWATKCQNSEWANEHNLPILPLYPIS